MNNLLRNRHATCNPEYSPIHIPHTAQIMEDSLLLFRLAPTPAVRQPESQKEQRSR